MKIVNLLNECSGFISARASTEERLKAEKIMNKLNLTSHCALVRQLIAEKADQLGVASWLIHLEVAKHFFMSSIHKQVTFSED